MKLLNSLLIVLLTWLYSICMLVLAKTLYNGVSNIQAVIISFSLWLMFSLAVAIVFQYPKRRL